MAHSFGTCSIEVKSGTRIMARPTTVQFFKCPSCDALYQVVKAEAGPETSDGKIPCRVCGAPLAARDGEFVLKYFLLRQGGRKEVWQKRRSRPASP